MICNIFWLFNKEGPEEPLEENSQKYENKSLVTSKILLSNITYCLSHVCSNVFNVMIHKGFTKNITGKIILSRTIKGILIKSDEEDTNPSVLGRNWYNKTSQLNFKEISGSSSAYSLSRPPTRIYKEDRLYSSHSFRRQKRLSVSKKNKLDIKRSLDFLHVDLFGPVSTQSQGGKGYSLVIVDDFSRFTWISLLKTKGEALDHLKNLFSIIEQKCQIKKIRSNYSFEFKNTGIEEYCSNIGIIHNLTTSRAPQQNGVAERTFKIICGLARTMLAEHNLPKKLWKEAVSTAVYVRNKTMIHHQKTPYELLNDRKPVKGELLAFGSKCYIHKGKNYLDRGKDKFDECIFLGYSSQSKRRIVYNKRNHAVEETTFLEFEDDTML